MNRIALLVVLLLGCGSWDPGIEWLADYKVLHQDSALDEVRFAVEAYYQLEVQPHDYEVRWTNTSCPHAPDRRAVVWKDECYYGLTFGCTMYVAQSSRAGEICHTALLHEYGHCIRHTLGWTQNNHDDTEYWLLVHSLGGGFCE